MCKSGECETGLSGSMNITLLIAVQKASRERRSHVYFSTAETQGIHVPAESCPDFCLSSALAWGILELTTGPRVRHVVIYQESQTYAVLGLLPIPFQD